MFAQFDNHHHGAAHVGIWLAMPLGAQEALVYADPKRFFVPPYVGKRGWVGVRLDARPSWSTVEKVMREAYDFIQSPRPRKGDRGRVRGARTTPPSGTGAPPDQRR